MSKKELSKEERDVLLTRLTPWVKQRGFYAVKPFSHPLPEVSTLSREQLHRIRKMMKGEL